MINSCQKLWDALINKSNVQELIIYILCKVGKQTFSLKRSHILTNFSSNTKRLFGFSKCKLLLQTTSPATTSVAIQLWILIAMRSPRSLSFNPLKLRALRIKLATEQRLSLKPCQKFPSCRSSWSSTHKWLPPTWTTRSSILNGDLQNRPTTKPT